MLGEVRIVQRLADILLAAGQGWRALAAIFAGPVHIGGSQSGTHGGVEVAGCMACCHNGLVRRAADQARRGEVGSFLRLVGWQELAGENPVPTDARCFLGCYDLAPGKHGQHGDDVAAAQFLDGRGSVWPRLEHMPCGGQFVLVPLI